MQAMSQTRACYQLYEGLPHPQQIQTQRNRISPQPASPSTRIIHLNPHPNQSALNNQPKTPSAMDYLPPLLQQRTLSTLTLITSFSRQFDLDPVIVGLIVLSISFIATSILMWVLSYMRILILVGLVLAAGNVSLRFVRRELPILGGAGRGVGDGGKRERIEGLEGVEANIREVIEEEERREQEA